MNTNNDDFTYDELNFDGLERRGNYRIIAYREDVLHALDRKDPAAIIYQIVFRWQTEFKKPEVLKKIEERKKAGLKPYTPKEIEDMMYVFMSYNDFVRESGGALGYNTVIRMLDYLINTKKVLYQRENHNPKYHDFEYSVNKNAMRELLKALPIEPVFAPKIPKKKSKSTQMGRVDNGSGYSTQMGTPTDEIDSTQVGIQSTHLGRGSTQMGTEVYPNGGTSHITTHTTHSNHTEREDTRITAHAGDATPSPSFANGEDDATNVPHGTHHHGSNTLERDNTQPDLLQAQTDTSGVAQPTEKATTSTVEIPQLNRLINPPEPLTENISSTDESPREIEAETAEHTPSSPVVNAATDVVIHVDTRNTTNSYSPSSESKTPETDPVTEQAEPPVIGKGSGKRGGGKKSAEKPYATKKEDPLKERMEQVCLSFEEIGREMFVDPEFHVDRPTSPRTELHKALVGFLDQKGSREGLRLVFMDMWNEANATGEYFWRDPKHLTLRALCKNYSTRLASVRFNAKKQTGDKDKLPRPQSVSGLRNYTYEKGDPTPPPSALPFEIAPQSSPEPLVKPGEQPTTRKKLYIKRPARNIS